MRADLIEHYGTDLSVVNAARVSFANESDWDVEVKEDSNGMYYENVLSERDQKLVNYLAKNKHTSCFEHQGATFRLKVPIFIARQIQRHRTFSYNEVSRRYVDTPPEFFFPDKWRAKADNVKQGSGGEHSEQELWTVNTEDFVREAVNMYNWMLADGVAPEQARMILPQNMYTEFYMTGNLRNWAHFLKLRLDAHAQAEVQDVAKQVSAILGTLFPVSMKALLSYD